MTPREIEDARLLIQCLFEMTDPENSEADQAADLLDEFVNKVEGSLFPDTRSGTMSRLRNRMTGIRRKVQDAATQEEGRTRRS